MLMLLSRVDHCLIDEQPQGVPTLLRGQVIQPLANLASPIDKVLIRTRFSDAIDSRARELSSFSRAVSSRSRMNLR